MTFETYAYVTEISVAGTRKHDFGAKVVINQHPNPGYTLPLYEFNVRGVLTTEESMMLNELTERIAERVKRELKDGLA
jgi:hypothetical protein